MQCANKAQEFIEQARDGMEFPKGPLFNFEKKVTKTVNKNGTQTSETIKRIDPETIEALAKVGILPEVINQLPAFPDKIALCFKRPIVNQHSRGKKQFEFANIV